MAPIAATVITVQGGLPGSSFDRARLPSTTNEKSGGSMGRRGVSAMEISTFGGGAGATTVVSRGFGTGSGTSILARIFPGSRSRAGVEVSSVFSSSCLANSFPGSKVKTRRTIPSATFRYFCGLSFHGGSSIKTRAFSRSRSKLAGNGAVTRSSVDIFISHSEHPAGASRPSWS